MLLRNFRLDTTAIRFLVLNSKIYPSRNSNFSGIVKPPNLAKPGIWLIQNLQGCPAIAKFLLVSHANHVPWLLASSRSRPMTANFKLAASKDRQYFTISGVERGEDSRVLHVIKTAQSYTHGAMCGAVLVLSTSESWNDLECIIWFLCYFRNFSAAILNPGLVQSYH